MAPTPLIWTVANRLLDCAAAEIATTTGGAPLTSCVTMGEVAWDECTCGELRITFQRESPSLQFPNPVGNSNNEFSTTRCGHPLQVWMLEMSMLRCQPVGEGNEPPDCADLELASQLAVEDAIAMRGAVECCLQTEYNTKSALGVRNVNQWLTGVQTFVGPQGACGGSVLPITIAQLASCRCS